MHKVTVATNDNELAVKRALSKHTNPMECDICSNFFKNFSGACIKIKNVDQKIFFNKNLENFAHIMCDSNLCDLKKNIRFLRQEHLILENSPKKEHFRNPCPCLIEEESYRTALCHYIDVEIM
ncbi:hypothetical protein BpHYR1_035057 [Brachionus plicatilis]|uniref:Uncharacterized protein n=1 Tax=Brachionus plicatilis TaxID=10195 RepID=A0A3M7SZP6_BRAPC|nr:hypothetical protein BpHYR1_035057 [Brachionus plicatilis]